MSSTTPPSGKFIDSLRLSSKGIRDSRAAALYEAAEIAYRRRLEDLELALSSLRREREDLVDLHGDSALSLRPGKDFDAHAFAGKDLDLGYSIREKEVQLEVARRQYAELFTAQGPVTTAPQEKDIVDRLEDAVTE